MSVVGRNEGKKEERQKRVSSRSHQTCLPILPLVIKHPPPVCRNLPVLRRLSITAIVPRINRSVLTPLVTATVLCSAKFPRFCCSPHWSYAMHPSRTQTSILPSVSRPRCRPCDRAWSTHSVRVFGLSTLTISLIRLTGTSFAHVLVLTWIATGTSAVLTLIGDIWHGRHGTFKGGHDPQAISACDADPGLIAEMKRSYASGGAESQAEQELPENGTYYRVSSRQSRF
jgi:hypothetical protein